MKNTHLIETSTNNNYIYNFEAERLFLVSPDFKNVIIGKSGLINPINANYYEKKMSYFKKYHLLKEQIPKRRFMAITPEMVERSIINTNQITFEVTDKCNLACTYCGYRDLYNDYDERKGVDLDVQKAISILDKMCLLWNSSRNSSIHKMVDIGFYGGEPTLNMNFVERVIRHVRSLKNTNRRFSFSMTTNAVLLNKYIDFLCENEVYLLISLDGDKYGNIYRKDKHNNPVFDTIIHNVDMLKETYPDYFNKCVRFNVVLHDKNPLENIYTFFKEKYGKAPRVSTLSSTGRNEDKNEIFQSMHRNIDSELKNNKLKKMITKWFGIEAPGYLDFIYFTYLSMGSVYYDYNELICNRKYTSYIPTGTCLPFSKKIFLTVNSKILPCERISQSFVLGHINENLDYNQIALTYNTLFDKARKKCNLCYRYNSCSICLLESGGECNDFVDESSFYQRTKHYIEVMEDTPKEFRKIINHINIT